jgi:hypothetical protein
MNTDTPLTTKRAFWLEHLQAADRSGQNLSTYAQAHGLNVKQLYYWNKVLRQRGLHGHQVPSSALFKKAHVVASGACRVILPTGVTLELDSVHEPAWLAQLLGALS